MKLSIIVPVYNVEQYLEHCVRSIMAQGVDDCEVLLIDDGSTDRSGELCDELKSRYECIHVVHQQNGGLSAARNTGLDRAQGEYITFVDSDDELCPGTLKENLGYLTSHPEVDMLEYPVEVYSEVEKPSRLDFSDETVHANIFFDWIRREGYMHSYAWNKIYRASLWKDMRFAVGRYFEDGDVMPLVVQRCQCVYYSSVGCYHYILRRGSITTDYKYIKQRHLFENNYRLYLTIKENSELHSESLRLWTCCLNQFVDMGRCKDIDAKEWCCLMGKFEKESPSWRTILKMALKEGLLKLLPLPILGLKNYLRCYTMLVSRL